MLFPNPTRRTFFFTRFPSLFFLRPPHRPSAPSRRKKRTQCRPEDVATLLWVEIDVGPCPGFLAQSHPEIRRRQKVDDGGSKHRGVIVAHHPATFTNLELLWASGPCRTLTNPLRPPGKVVRHLR